MFALKHSSETLFNTRLHVHFRVKYSIGISGMYIINVWFVCNVCNLWNVFTVCSVMYGMYVIVMYGMYVICMVCM